MHFLLLSPTYYPEKKSASFMLKELAENFVSNGHSMSVITFSHDIDSELMKENIEGVSIIRLKVSNPKYSKIKRALVELSYSKKIIKFIKKNDLENVDALIFFSPSIFFGQAVNFIKSFYSIKSYLIVRDIFPDWLVKIKQLNKGLIYYFFKIYEYINFRSANFIGTESIADIQHVTKIIGSKNIEVEQLRNWFSRPRNINNNVLEKELVSSSKINIVYGGSLGLAQNIVSFLTTLEKQESSKLLNLTIVGDGVQKLELEEFSKRSKMDINIMPMMERGDYFDLVSKSDAGLVVLDKNLEANNYPGKSFDYMYCKKPLFCFLHENNEFGKLIEKEDLGYFIKANQNEVFEDLLNSLVKDEELRNLKGENAYSYLNKYFSAENAFIQIENKFLKK